MGTTSLASKINSIDKWFCDYKSRVDIQLLFRHSKLATVVEGDQKAPFSIATTPRCRGGCYSFPWIAPLYPWYIPYITEC